MTRQSGSGVTANWTDEKNRILVAQHVKEITDNGQLADAGALKPEQMDRITAAFNTAKGGDKYDKKQVTSQISKLKKVYQKLKALVDLSGAGWNSELNVPTMADKDAYIAAHPDAAPLFDKPFEFYEDLDKLYTGKLATGKYAASGDDPKKSQSKKRCRDAALDATPGSGDEEEGGEEVVSPSAILLVPSTNGHRIAALCQMCSIVVAALYSSGFFGSAILALLC